MMGRARWIGSCCIVLALGVLGLGPSVLAGFDLEADVGLAAAVALAEAHIGWLIDGMHVLTETAELQAGDWEGMRGLLGHFEESAVSYNAWFLLPDGSYYKVATGQASANLSDRAYFPKVMAGEATLGDLVVSRSTGRKSMVLMAPIERDGSVIGALGVTLYLDDFSRLIARSLDLPETVIFFAHDGAGRIAVHSNIDLLMEDVAAAGIDPETSVSRVSDLLGWTFVLGRSE